MLESTLMRTTACPLCASWRLAGSLIGAVLQAVACSVTCFVTPVVAGAGEGRWGSACYTRMNESLKLANF